MSELELTGVGREVVLQLESLRERRVKEFKVKARET